MDVLAKVSECVTLSMASGSTQRGMIKVSRMKASPRENDGSCRDTTVGPQLCTPALKNEDCKGD